MNPVTSTLRKEYRVEEKICLAVINRKSGIQLMSISKQVSVDACNRFGSQFKVVGSASKNLFVHDRLKLYKSEEGFNAIMAWYESLVEQIEIPCNSQYVETRFGRTHMLVCGPEDAEPLVLVQAVAGNAPLWRNQLPALAQHFRVYALDTVGQPGLSDPNPPSYIEAKSEFSDWLTDVLDELNIEKSHFAGVSAGGWQIMRLAAEHPERVNKLVMLSPMGVSHARLPWKIWVTKVLSKKRSTNQLEDDLTAKSVRSPSAKGSFGSFDRQLARGMALCTRHFRIDRSLGVYNDSTQKVSIVKGLKVLKRFFLSDTKQAIKSVQSESLVIFGEHEILYDPYKVSKRVESLIPNVTAKVIPEAGHAAIYDQPKKVNPMIVDFLLNK
jgi:pimeloyl-ACP methyl ester carboxylesterase